MTLTPNLYYLNGARFLEGHKLFDDTYLCVFDKFLAIVKVNKDGEIVKVSTFGERRETK